MVSGWDKHPGPDNDYASKPWSKASLIVFGIILIVGTVALAYALAR